MLVSHTWLNEYFDGKLPAPADLARIITMGAFEVESIEEHGGDVVIDVKILPNRAHDCLSHRGIAREIGMLLGIPPKFPGLKSYPDSKPTALKVNVESEYGRRYIGRRISNVNVGQSPEWLKKKLEMLGQRSINNIVDATNYVMFELGQPMHAFDADKVKGAISVRISRAGERIRTLDSKEIDLGNSTLIIADEEKPLAIAGIKGGTAAEVDESTNRVILESANFAPGNVRKTSAKLGLKTDASKRFENEISPELADEAMELATSVVAEIAGTTETEFEEKADVYPRRRQPYKVGVSAGELNRLLGTALTEADIEAVLNRTGWSWKAVEPRSAIVSRARELVGKPYKLGASVSHDAPDLFDCSSFTSYLYAEAGISIPRISVDQFAYGEAVEMSALRPGELVFSNSGSGMIHYETKEWLRGTKVAEGVDHVGIWLGDGQIVHASRHNGTGSVDLEPMSDSKQFKNIVGARRIPAADGKRYVVTVPHCRLDIRIKEDLIEEIGRLYGYDKIPASPPAPAKSEPAVNKALAYAEKIRRILSSLGFSEVYTYAFADSGDVEVANPIASDKGYLRANLADGVARSLEHSLRYADLLGLETVKIFEIGKVFSAEREHAALCIAVDSMKNPKKRDEEAKSALDEALRSLEKDLGGTCDAAASEKGNIAEVDLDAYISNLPELSAYDVPSQFADTKYKAFSPYPFVLRDIAVWVPEDVKEADVLGIIIQESGALLVRSRIFDVFSKEIDGAKKTSYAFRLVFQSHEKTLTDYEVNAIMERVTFKLNSNSGWAVR